MAVLLGGYDDVGGGGLDDDLLVDLGVTEVPGEKACREAEVFEFGLAALLGRLGDILDAVGELERFEEGMSARQSLYMEGTGRDDDVVGVASRRGQPPWVV